MNEVLVIEIAKCKMRELGYGDKYNLRMRHFILQGKEKKTINTSEDIYILFNPGQYNRVTSSAGIYEPNAQFSDELQYVHSGTIKLSNLNENATTGFTFLQVSPQK